VQGAGVPVWPWLARADQNFVGAILARPSFMTEALRIVVVAPDLALTDPCDELAVAQAA
jgi:hypothetical protein